MPDPWFRLTAANAHATLTAQATTALDSFADALASDGRLSAAQREGALAMARAVADRERDKILLTLAGQSTAQE